MHLKSGVFLQHGKYKIIRILGQGGFGITYLAEHTMFGHFVAIKELFPDKLCGRDGEYNVTLGSQNSTGDFTKLKERFLKEAKNIAKLDSPNIVKIHDIFEENGTAYYVMDYVEGVTLKELVMQRGPLPPADALHYITNIGKALEYIHSKMMTHFDVKPANIMVRSEDNEPILIDFGLSKQYDANGDATSTMLNAFSAGYAPIEMYNSRVIDSFSPRIDIYSLGCTIYYLLVGRTPPEATQRIEDDTTEMGRIPSSIRPALEKAMSLRKSDRFATMAEFLNTLKNQGSTTYAHNTSSYANESDVTEQTRILDSDNIESEYPSHARPAKISRAKKLNNKRIGCWVISIFLFIILLALFLMYLGASVEYPSDTLPEDTTGIDYECVEVAVESPQTDTISYSARRYAKSAEEYTNTFSGYFEDEDFGGKYHQYPVTLDFIEDGEGNILRAVYHNDYAGGMLVMDYRELDNDRIRLSAYTRDNQAFVITLNFDYEQGCLKGKASVGSLRYDVWVWRTD